MQKDIEHENSNIEVLQVTNYLIKENCKLYLGIPTKWFWLIDVLSKECKTKPEYITLTLMKIKLNDNFERLASEFVCSTLNASRVFDSCVPKIAFFCKNLFIFHQKLVWKNLCQFQRCFFNNGLFQGFN